MDRKSSRGANPQQCVHLVPAQVRLHNAVKWHTSHLLPSLFPNFPSGHSSTQVFPCLGDMGPTRHHLHDRMSGLFLKWHGNSLHVVRTLTHDDTCIQMFFLSSIRSCGQISSAEFGTIPSNWPQCHSVTCSVQTC